MDRAHKLNERSFLAGQSASWVGCLNSGRGVERRFVNGLDMKRSQIRELYLKRSFFGGLEVGMTLVGGAMTEVKQRPSRYYNININSSRGLNGRYGHHLSLKRPIYPTRRTTLMDLYCNSVRTGWRASGEWFSGLLQSTVYGL
jgi:hypothetical protein